MHINPIYPAKEMKVGLELVMDVNTEMDTDMEMYLGMNTSATCH